jgi:hypothetical protein
VCLFAALRGTFLKNSELRETGQIVLSCPIAGKSFIKEV